MNREEWLKERNTGIGGSDSPVIVLGDKHPFKTPFEVWQDKMGVNTPSIETAAMKRGTALEPLIADLFSQKTFLTLKVPEKSCVHPEYPFLRGNIDRFIIFDNDEQGILEIKCPGLRTFSKCKREGPEDYYLIQIQHYFLVTGACHGALAIFNPELWELLVFEIERDDEMISLILEADVDFWENYVVAGIPPKNTTIAAVYDKLPKIEFQTELKHIDSDEWQEAIENYRVAKELSEEAKMLEDEAKERIQQIMTAWDANVMEGRGARCYWKEQKGRATLDRKALAAAHPEIDLSQFEKISAPSRTLRVYLLNNKEVA